MPPTMVLNTFSDRGKCLPRRLAHNNVILWATASCSQHPGAILGRDRTRPGTNVPTVRPTTCPPSLSLPSCLCWHPGVLPAQSWIGEAGEDVWTSSFLCLATVAFFSVFFLGFFLPCTRPSTAFFYELSPAGTDTRMFSAGGQLQALESITDNELHR